MNSEHRTIVDLLQQKASEHHNKKLYSFVSRQGDCSYHLTFGALYDKARKVAAILQSAEIVARPVLLYYPHGPDFIVAFFGAILAGAWPVPASKGRGRQWHTVLAVVEACAARTILTTETRQYALMANLPEEYGVQILSIDESTLRESQCTADNWLQPEVSGNDIAFIQCTSGSTAQPKGVVITHQNVLHNSLTIKSAFQISSHDVGLCWLPFHHDMGLIGHIVQPLFAGIHNYFVNPVDFVADPMRWLRAISRYRVTISGGPDFAYAHCCVCTESNLYDFDLSRWRIAYSGSERILPDTMRRFAASYRNAGFNSEAFFPCYGMAEATLFVSGRRGLQLTDCVSTAESTTGRYQNVSLGSADDQTDIKVVDPDTGEPLPDGQIGEIYIRSPAVSPGYYLHNEVVAKNFNTKLGTESGYFRTGDVGRIQGGSLYFEGRLKNLIKRRGVSVFSEDVEAQVELKMNRFGVSRCAAFSVWRGAQEQLVLLLEVDEESRASACDKLKHEVSAAVLEASGIVVDVIRFLSRNTLPLTSSGKLRRTACRELYLDPDSLSVTPQQEVVL